MSSLISLISPCLNGENYVHHFLDSLLSQTYRRIELIFVNDGSTDGTERVVLGYAEKLEAAGIRLKYVYQENKGLAGAINTGLEQVSGEFICWADSDDFFEPGSFEKRLRAFDTLDQHVAVVTSDAAIRPADDLQQLISKNSAHTTDNHNPRQFEYLLKGESIFCSGAHMVRAKAFWKAHPTGQIYPARRGQNWQLLLPLYYHFDRFFLDEPLYNIVRHESSMSQNDKTFEKQIFRSNEHRTIISETLKAIEMPEAERLGYLTFIQKRYTYKNFRIAARFGEKAAARQYYQQLNALKGIDTKARLLYAKTLMGF